MKYGVIALMERGYGAPKFIDLGKQFSSRRAAANFIKNNNEEMQAFIEQCHKDSFNKLEFAEYLFTECITVMYKTEGK